MGKKKRWVRLKRAIQWLKKVNVEPSRGDGGFITDKTLIVTKPQIDSSFVIKDTSVIARPKQ